MRGIEGAIEDVIDRVLDVEAVYTSPIFTLGRKLPAVTILYDGFSQTHGPGFHGEVTYTFDITLYLPFEGRNPETNWHNVQDLTIEILKEFRKDPGLGGTVWQSLVESGEPIIEVPSGSQDKPKWIGHSFELTARLEASHND